MQHNGSQKLVGRSKRAPSFIHMSLVERAMEISRAAKIFARSLVAARRSLRESPSRSPPSLRRWWSVLVAASRSFLTAAASAWELCS